MSRIARWDGTNWSGLGSGMTAVFTPSVRALAVHDDGSGPALYAAGVFTSVGGVAAQHVARWDGSGWTALGAGLSSTVEVLFAHDHGSGPLLYAGGSLGRRLARWDGSLWTTMGLDMNGPVEALGSFDDGHGPALFVGGGFTSSPAGDSHLAKFGCRPKPTVKPRKL